MFSDFIAVQQELPKVKKSKSVRAGGQRYNYATLEDLIEIARPVLNKHGFAVSQKVFTNENGALSVETVLLHKSGQTISSGAIAVPIPMQGNIAQSIGSARTYACRYSLASVLCLADTEDDDAQSYGNATTLNNNQKVAFGAQRQQVLNQFGVNNK